MKQSKSIKIVGIIFEIFLLINSVYSQMSDFPPIIQTTEPKISLVAIAVRATGSVTVQVTINSNGSVISVKSIRGHPLLRQVTEEAVMQLKFAPSKEQIRTFQLEFDYPPSIYHESPFIVVSPYQLKLKITFPERPKPSEIMSYISHNWKLKIDRCKVHRELLKKDKVEIIYGLTIFREGYLEAVNKLFPNAIMEMYGGCVVDIVEDTKEQISPKYAEVLYCHKCRIAYQKWTKANQNKPFNSK